MLEKYAFGTYRTTDKSPIHRDALKYALDNKITHIDTSSNYMHGDAERLIGNELKNRNRENFTIVSKGGYIQGENMKMVQEGYKVEDLVIYDENCYHSIHPNFISDQIDKSLERLQTDYIDVYLLHNPEYYLLKEIKQGMTLEAIKNFQNIMQERIKKAFVLLEEKVKEGKIKAYGISSNSFAKKANDIHFLEYKYLIEYAKEIAGENHNLKVIQLPMNIFETYGEEAAKWAYKNALEVHINRPLNSFREKEMIRLASYECPQNYENLLNQIRQIDNQDLQEVVNQIINIENEYRWAGDVDDIIEYQVVPYIMQNLNLESNTYVLLNDYLESYKQKVKYQISTKEAKKLNLEEPMDKTALKFLEEKEYITRILVGMRREE